MAFITSYIFVLYSGKAVRSDSVIGKECSTETVVKGDVTFLWIATTICWVYLIIREFLQFGIAPKRYIFSLGNLLRGIDNCSGAARSVANVCLKALDNSFQ